MIRVLPPHLLALGYALSLAPVLVRRASSPRAQVVMTFACLAPIAVATLLVEPGAHAFLGVEGAFIIYRPQLFLMLVVSSAFVLLSLHAAVLGLMPPSRLAAAAALLTSSLGIIMTNNLLMLMVMMEAALAASVALLSERRPEAVEASMKVGLMLMLGGLLMVAALGMLVAALGARSLSALSLDRLPAAVSGSSSPLAMLALALFIASLGIETGLAPFHMWLPDAYSGPAAPMVALFVISVDTADLYTLLRVLPACTPMPRALWIIAVVALLSVIIGEVSALTQERMRRVFGYSGVADAGYLTLLAAYLFCVRADVIHPSVEGAPALFFLAFSNVALASAVALIGLLESSGARTLEEARGMAWRRPVTTILLLVSIFSVAGIPPLAGFIAKYLLLFALARSQLAPLVYPLLAFLAVCAAYVLRITMYLAARPERASRLPEPKAALLTVLPLVLLLFVAGLAPGIFIKFISVR